MINHVVLDNFLPGTLADSIYKELKNTEVTDEWYKYESPFEKKKATDDWVLFPEKTRYFFMTTLTGPFVTMVEEKLNMTGLVSDGSIRGGGIHIQEKDSFLHIHADMQMHPKLGLYRRANAILFMNKGWGKNWGGDLEFWSEDMTKCEVKIAPKFNRLVIFETHAKSFHGVPDPIKCPPTHRRMSLAMYYWSATMPAGVPVNINSTDFRARPGDLVIPEVEELRAQRLKGRLSSNV